MEPSSLPTIRIMVRGGKVAGVEVLSSTPPGNPSTLPGVTINGLFDELQKSVPANPGKCTSLDLKFDPVDGHPLSYGFGNETQGLQDGHGGFSVSNFTRL